MANKSRISGPEQIERAKELFDKTGDYQYVALAIGAAPIAPPFWAIWECVALHRRQETRAKTGLRDVDAILDEMIRQIGREHFSRLDSREKNNQLDDPYPSLAEIIRRACVVTRLRADKLSHDAEANWSRDIRRAWDDEQNLPVNYDVWELPNVKTTLRVERVLTEMVGEELGLPQSPIRDLWLQSGTRED